MFNRSIISIAIITLASLSSFVNAEDNLDIDTVSAEPEALAELRLSNQGVNQASATMTQSLDTQANSHIYTSGRNWVTVTDYDEHSASAKHLNTKNHR